MLGRTNTGGGGGGLNFKVVPNPQPSTAKENTIWVDTDKINNYYFSATQPENMVDYDVWFPVGTSSSVEFNALKKQNIMVYPISAKQYVSGAWVDVTAKSYQGGEWVEWVTWLYKDGSQNEDLTGGWITISEPTTNMAVEYADKINVTMYSGSGIGCLIRTKNPIDVTDLSWINAKGLITARYDTSRFIEICVCKSIPSNYTYTAASATKMTSMNAQDDIDVDLRQLTGKYYIVINCCGISGNVSDIGVR